MIDKEKTTIFSDLHPDSHHAFASSSRTSRQIGVALAPLGVEAHDGKCTQQQDTQQPPCSPTSPPRTCNACNCSAACGPGAPDLQRRGQAALSRLVALRARVGADIGLAHPTLPARAAIDFCARDANVLERISDALALDIHWRLALAR